MSGRLVRIMVAVLGFAVAVPPVAVLAAQKPPVRVGGSVKEPKKIKDVKPVYPKEAQEAGVQGMVILEVVIGKDGSVTSAKVLRQVPLLEKAALDAVEQWKYEPTVIDDEAVEVLMVVTVNFALKAPAAAPAAQQPPVRVYGGVEEPKRIRHVPPVYPALARQARIQGTVIIEATIGTDGSVVDAKVLRSVPLLDAAALEAVAQWKFQPTLIDGAPVQVVMAVTVNFSLK